ncbi:unnamed protein product [Calypogeia fissa]
MAMACAFPVASSASAGLASSSTRCISTLSSQGSTRGSAGASTTARRFLTQAATLGRKWSFEAGCHPLMVGGPSQTIQSLLTGWSFNRISYQETNNTGSYFSTLYQAQEHIT